MAVNKPHLYDPGIYFITFTNYRWLPLFELTQGYDLVYQWFNVLRSKGHEITGYVIMLNHLHLLLVYRQCHQSLNTITGNGKRFMAYDIVERLQQRKEEKILRLLAAGIGAKERKLHKLHQVFQPSFDAKICLSQPFLLQKLNYMHANPVSGKWQLAADPIDYLHSSALFYETGRQGVFPVKSWMELELDLSFIKITYRGEV